MAAKPSKPLTRSTITDVARAAGVATGTVSRVLNNHADVNEDIRERVRKAAEELGYVRLRQRKRARNGSAATSGNIGLICFGMENTLVQIPIVSHALQGIEIILSGTGRNLVFANIPNGDRVPPFVSENRVEGLILKGPNQGLLPSVKECELLRQVYRFPHIWLMGKLENAVGDHCNFDTSRVAQLALQHLREKGHRRVTFMNPKPGQTQFEKVKRSFMSYAPEFDIETTLLEPEHPEAPHWPLPAITQPENVDELTNQWAQTAKNKRSTAIFVPSDRTAVQLYSALERRNLRAGRDVSVISCNNESSLVNPLHPGLTSVDVHAEAVGRRAVDQLLWRIEHRNEPGDIQLLLEPTLCVRESVRQL
jgi:DNA-binding LacI/PurR family transcriptional regulator